MIEFIEREDGAVIVNRKGDDFLGVIENNSDGKPVFTSMGSTTIEGFELLIITATTLGDVSYGEYIQELIKEEFRLEIRIVEEE